MYLICGGIMCFVAAVCVVFAVRAWRAGKAIGMDTAVLRRVVTSSASFSVLPSVGILLGVIALSGALGIPWPWLRLSVIGALHYETQVAEGAAEQVGIHLSGSEMTAGAFSTIALLMSVCIMWGMILNLFLNKRYTEPPGQAAGESGRASFGDEAMTAMFIGLVSAYRVLSGPVDLRNGRFTFAGTRASALYGSVRRGDDGPGDLHCGKAPLKVAGGCFSCPLDAFRHDLRRAAAAPDVKGGMEGGTGKNHRTV